MRCKHCNDRIASHDLWCVTCGKQTNLPKNELSAIQSMRNTWNRLVKEPNKPLAAGAVTVLLGIMPVIGLTVFFRTIHLELSTNTTLAYLMEILIKLVAYSLFVPFTLLGFGATASKSDYRLEFADIKASLRSYPAYMLLSLIVGAFFTLFYLVCFGLPIFAADPILRLVWIVLINYWIAVILPAPVLMKTHSLGPIAAIKLSYCHFHDLRWNLYLMSLILVVLIIFAAVPLLLGLLLIIPFTWFAIRDYIKLLVEYELLEYRR